MQWQVLDRAFSGHATMVLIGDPKQAIYAFRGGDVTTYLTAAATAATQQTLSVNWRSDAALLSAMQELLRGAALGDERIVVRDVEAHHTESRLVGAGNPFRVRVIRRQDVSRRPGLLAVAQVRPRIARDLAHDVRRLLDSGATFDGRPVRPRDIAVISYRHADLADAQAALLDVGVPGVIAGGGSVFATPAGGDWLTLLEALEQPHRSTRVRSAALTCFFGHTAADLDARGDDLTDEVAETLRTWLELFGSRGLAAVMEAASIAGLPARVLAEVGGDRRLTDLRHIGEALHEVALTERHGLVSLLTWLREQVGEGRAGRGLERTRRLDSDAAAVQLVTIHASKGLEYPVVYLPAVSDRHVAEPDLPRFHDDAGRRCRNVGAGGAGWADHVRRAQEEDAGEWLRLLYVALTRAQSQVVCWWSPTKNTLASPLHRMLMRAADSSEVPDQPQVPSDDDAVALFAQWRDRGGPAPELATPPGLDGAGPVAEVPVLGVRAFTRTVDAAWRRTSYSSLSAVRAETVVDAVTSEPEVVGKDDEEIAPDAVVAAAPDIGADVASPMANLPVGATFGSLVHAVLEHADPAASRLPGRAARPHRRAAGLVAGRARPRGARRRAGRRLRLAAGRSGRPAGRGDAARRPAHRPAARDGLRAAAGRRRRARPHGRRPAGRPGPAPGAAPARGRPGAGVRRAAARSARRPGAARLPHRVGRRGAARADGRRPAVPRRRLQDQLARPLRRAADRRGLPARGDGRRDGALRLPAPGPAVRRRAAPLPALAAARLRPRATPRRGALPLRPRHVRAGHPDRRRGPVRGVHLARAGAARRGALRPAGRAGGVAMTELFEPTSEHDWRLARGRTGLLAAFNDGLLLTSADLHVAARVGALGREDDERVLLALALAVRAVRRGSVCLSLDEVRAAAPDLPWPDAEAWADAVRRSTLVDAGVLRWDHRAAVPRPLPPPRDPGVRRPRRPRLAAARRSSTRRGWRPRSGQVRGEHASPQQVEAAATAVRRWTTILTGGPGTGKTTTVARMLALLADQAAARGERISVALTAPTGKAASRLQEAVTAELAGLTGVPDAVALLGHPQGVTLHRLLGWRPDNATRFRHDRGNRLKHDVVVVDESSMVELTMMARLLEALRPDSRLILVGDPEQLTSVGAGAVLSDLVRGYEGQADSPVVELTTNFRSKPEIKALGAALQAEDPDLVLDVLRTSTEHVSFVEASSEDDLVAALRPDLVAAASRIREHAESEDARGALDALDGHRLLCAHREGPFGVRRWNGLVERWLAEELGDLGGPWYVGRPLLATTNDYALDVYNGEIGVVVRQGLRRRVFISGAGTQRLRDFAPGRLDAVETMHAMTIHKAQGSQADRVTVLLPEEGSRLLTRELFYTAVTRAKEHVRVVGTEAAVRAAVTRRASRASGLAERLRDV